METLQMNMTDELAVLRQRYVARNKQSAARYETATAVMPGGNTRSVLYYDPFPLAIAKGEGAKLWDADGKQYTDFLAEFTAGLYGHSHPVIREAVMSAMDGGINLSGHNLLEATLAKLITERFPSIEQLRFTNSGTEANLLAIAAAKKFTKRKKILVFKGGYHGGVLTFAGGPSEVNVPHEFLLGKYNDLASTTALVKANASDIAAILVEPMQGAGGCIVGKDDFLRGLRALASDVGALLVFDEVMTSRTAPGGRQSVIGVKPDMTTLGKYIGGGMSFGAFGGRVDIMALFDPRVPGHMGHAGTFNNNVLTMSAGIAGLTKIYTADVATDLNRRGAALNKALNDICRKYEVNLQVTGIGSLMNLHASTKEILSEDDLSKEENTVKDLFFFFMLEEGFYVARRGFIVLSLPLTDDDIGRFTASFESFVDKYANILKS